MGRLCAGTPVISQEDIWLLLSLFFVHHFMEVRLHKNAFAFLSKPPGKCVCVHGTQTSTRGSAPVESASTVEGRLELVTLSRLSERFESLFIEEMQIRT